MSHRALYGPIALVGLVLALPSRAQYNAAVLPMPQPFTGAHAYAASEGQQAGAFVYGYGRAVLWNAVVGSAVNLDPGQFGSLALAAGPGSQAGVNYVTVIQIGSGRSGRSVPLPHAALWHGSDANMKDLNPSGAYQSAVNALSGSFQVGWAAPPPYYSAPYACLWSGTAASAVNLNPAGYLESAAEGVDGGVQVGWAMTSAAVEHAMLWKGTAAGAVDLEPNLTSAMGSDAVTVDAARNQQAGFVTVGTSGSYYNHAYLWSGSAASAVDMNPAGLGSSQVTAMRDGVEVGFGAVLYGQSQALLWRGTAASAVDLQAFLPAGVTSSVATSIDENGVIAGTATFGTYNPVTLGVVWLPASQARVVMTQNPAASAAGWTTAATNVHIYSPFRTLTSQIHYRVNGGALQNATGTQLLLAYPRGGTYQIEAYATNGNGATTPTEAYTANVDLTPPTTSMTFANPTVTLTAADANSGVAATYYTLDGGGQFTYTQAFTVANITHTLVYWSVDRAGNVESKHSATLAAVAPTLTAISPSEVLSGNSALTVTITGTGFNSTSVACWNGSPRVTSRISSTTVLAAILAADLATPGTYTVHVTNPAPGTGTTANAVFTVAQRATATGTAANVGEAGDTSFDISPVATYTGFTLTGATIHVTTSSRTVYEDGSGGGISSSQFFDILANGQSVSVIGTYDASSQTLSAWFAQLY
ncbi:MAG: IPT/TIG domain-containing protein [Armatimonadetes bacterium]|nr:IPT/TIG domain-containing protein [Armatimonadota bacterium]MDE2205843.1 IPT/TIG domain-containing protein [Armatimonadota bacterium]